MKRLIDLILGVLIAPYALLVSVVLGLTFRYLYRDKAFYRQQRPGQNDKPFVCLKINTMRSPQSEAEVLNKQSDLKRSTPLGNWMRNRGLDELPQIWNIIKG